MKASEIRKAIVNRANAIVGMSRYDLGMPGDYAWCAHFVSEVLRYVGINNMYDTSCTRLQAKMDVSPEWSEPDDHPIPGDYLFFDWDKIIEPLPLDHVGIVVDYDERTGTITYVNGNGNSSLLVTKQTMNINSKYIQYWMRYTGDQDIKPLPKPDPVPTPAKVMCKVELEQLSFGCKSPSVETMQNLLADVGYGLEVDGIFGDETKEALADFQKKNKLKVDSICGSKTWKALIEAV